MKEKAHQRKKIMCTRDGKTGIMHTSQKSRDRDEISQQKTGGKS